MEDDRDLYKYKFMVNIKRSSDSRQYPVKWITKLGALDNMLPARQMIFGTIASGVVLFIYVIMLLQDFLRLTYIIVPWTLVFIGAEILVLNYVIPSKDKPMLMTVIEHLAFLRFEKFRWKKRSTTSIKSIGIKGVKNGIIKFDNGSYGCMYRINGQFSFSVLPHVAKATILAKSQYLVGRSDTSQETIITSLRTIDMETQVKALNKCKKNANKGDYNDAFKVYMANILSDYIKDNISKQEYMIEQNIIVRDVDLPTLKKTLVNFENAVNSGLYSYAIKLRTNEIVSILEPLTMISKKGVKKFVEEE